jgi:hypothetical protein
MWHYIKKLKKSGSGKLLIAIQDNDLTGNVDVVRNTPSKDYTSDNKNVM